MHYLVTLLKETCCGKTIARTLFNLEIEKSVKNIGDIVIDLGGG